MGKDDVNILVIARDQLFSDDHFTGFLPAGDDSFLYRIRQHGTFKRRGDMEQDPSFLQPIPYVALVKRSTGEVFLYSRSKESAYTHESRLAGRVSIGVGGHIDEGDEAEGDPIARALRRELEEEVGITVPVEPVHAGYINFEEGVDAVHLGLAFVLEVPDDALDVDAKVIRSGRYEKIEGLADRITADGGVLEAWSVAFLEALPSVLNLPLARDA